MKNVNQKGFSLIEIMVVLVIMGLLASIVAPNVMNALSKGYAQKVQADFANLELALKMYKVDNFNFPSSDDGLEALVSKPASAPKGWTQPYLDELPLDPWGNRYFYVSPGETGKPYDIYTLGSDGVRGGEEEASDVTNWDQAGDA